MDDWFFNMGGRGSLESRGSRQKNALLSAGLISILGELYGDQFQTLILASQPERLGVEKNSSRFTWSHKG